MKSLRTLAVAAILAIPSHAAASPFAYAELKRTGQIVAGVDGDDRPGALYESGSIGKFACTLAALRLVDRGAFTLDDTLGELL
ncbi:MAG: hypothetical protein AAGE86_05625, partial [Pseudomonadota bacterium]